MTPLITKSKALLRALSLAPLLLTGACSSVDLLNTLSAASPSKATANLNFGDGHRDKLDIYRPSNNASSATRPVVVFFYGGSWNRGSKQDYAFVGHSLAERGYVTVIPDYRLYPEVRYPEFLKDNAKAIAWVRENISQHGGDPGRIFVMGHSAGAYNAAMMALDERWLAAHQLKPDLFKGWIGISGAYDFMPIGTPDVQPVFFHPNYPKDSQPIAFVSPQSPPVFLATSPQDELINPQRNTFGMAKKLDTQGVSTTLKTYDKVDHVSIIASMAWPLRFKSELLDDLDRFISTQKH